MDREERNPYVTRIELDHTESKIKETLRQEIRLVDEKHTDNNLFVRELMARSIATMEHLSDSSDKNTLAVEKMVDEMQKNQRELREDKEEANERLKNLELVTDNHNEFIAQQKEIMDGKRGSTLKWIGTLVPIFVAFLAGIFSIVEYLIPFLMSR